MDLSCAWAGLHAALSSSWDKLGFLTFLQILLQLLRPDVVDIGNQSRITAPGDLLPAYDFVIIGGGSAGGVVATRLSENANYTVLLLEAGGLPPAIAEIPLMEWFTQNSYIDWQFKTEPMTTACLGMENHQCLRPRGKVLGGSSILNSHMFVRGNRRDFDHWKELGNSRWGYDEVLPYYKKMENVSNSDLKNSSYHGTGGYLNIEEPRYRSPLTGRYLEAAVEMGYDLIDYNGESQSGFSNVQNNLRDGLRCSVEKAYLRPASLRENLHISTESMVEKILFDPITKATIGVIANVGGVKRTFYTNKEVILSAGSLQSPQLLMISGIGPKEHLEKFGIEVIHDSPGVGQNFQDHASASGLNFHYDDVSNDDPAKSTSPVLAAESTIKQFLEEKNGSLYSFTGDGAQGFIHTGMTRDPPDYPDVQLVFLPNGEDTVPLQEDFRVNKTFTIVAQLQRPKSKGNITLRSADPYDSPVIHANFLADKSDVDALVKACQMGYALTQTAAMKKINARPSPSLVPKCGPFNASSYEYFECHMRHSAFHAQHTVGTCKMGVATDPMAVVDPELKVYGMTGLRVIDGSIMPRITSGNTNAPIIMIGERGSDFIKADHAAGVKQRVVTQKILVDNTAFQTQS